MINSRLSASPGRLQYTLGSFGAVKAYGDSIPDSAWLRMRIETVRIQQFKNNSFRLYTALGWRVWNGGRLKPSAFVKGIESISPSIVRWCGHSLITDLCIISICVWVMDLSEVYIRGIKITDSMWNTHAKPGFVWDYSGIN